jgi:hypothetical protein
METVTELTQQFRLEEFKALRSEIMYQIQEIDRIKFWIAAAMALYYSFIAAKFLVVANNKISFTGPLWIWITPLILPILGYFRLRSQIGQLDLFAQYIRKIEDLFPGLPGWEHFYAQHRSEDTVWNYDEFYFVVLLLFSCAVLFARWRASKHERSEIRD